MKSTGQPEFRSFVDVTLSSLQTRVITLEARIQSSPGHGMGSVSVTQSLIIAKNY